MATKNSQFSWRVIWRHHLASHPSSHAPLTLKKCSSQAPLTCPKCCSLCPDKAQIQLCATQISTLWRYHLRRKATTSRCAARLRTSWWLAIPLEALLFSPPQNPSLWTNTTSERQKVPGASTNDLTEQVVVVVINNKMHATPLLNIWPASHPYLNALSKTIVAHS